MKKWLIIFGIIFVVQIPFNLHYHAYYYATHMKADGDKYYRFAPLLGNNYLPQSYVPGYKIEHIDLREATKNVVTKTNVLTHKDKIEINPQFANYYPSKHQNDFYTITFSNDGKAEPDEELENLPNNTKQRAYASLNRFNQTLKEHSSCPILNLQWLWNIWYRVSN